MRTPATRRKMRERVRHCPGTGTTHVTDGWQSLRSTALTIIWQIHSSLIWQGLSTWHLGSIFHIFTSTYLISTVCHVFFQVKMHSHDLCITFLFWKFLHLAFNIQFLCKQNTPSHFHFVAQQQHLVNNIYNAEWPIQQVCFWCAASLSSTQPVLIVHIECSFWKYVVLVQKNSQYAIVVFFLQSNFPPAPLQWRSIQDWQFRGMHCTVLQLFRGNDIASRNI